MQANTVDTLSFFGHSFQTKAVTTLLTDISFLSSVEDIVEPDFFENDANKWIVRIIKEYYQEYGTTPTLDVFAIKRKELDSDILKETIKIELKSAYSSVDAGDLDFVKKEFREFCKNQKLKSAIVTSVDLLKLGQYDDIKLRIDAALNSGDDTDIGHSYVAEFQDRMENIARETVATPWEVINDIMDGGLGPGELGCVVAPSGIGKSWFLQKIGADCLNRGFTVAHYTLELAEKYTGKRYDSILAGVETQKLPDYQDRLKGIIDNLTGEVIIKYYPTKTASSRTIEAHVNKLVLMGKRPDIILIDYADLMKPSGKVADKKYEELGNLYEELRGISGELGIPIWTASQANRDSIEKEIIQANSIADSYQKVMTADFVMSVSRRAKDKVSDTARVHIVKNRFGPDGMTFPTTMDASFGKIEIHDPNSSTGIITSKQSAKGQELEKQILKKKFNELMD